MTNAAPGAAESEAIRLWQSFRDYLKVEFKVETPGQKGRTTVTARVTNAAPAGPDSPLIVFEAISATAWVVVANSKVLWVDVPTRVSTAGQTPEVRVADLVFPALYPGQSLAYSLKAPAEHLNTLRFRVRASVSPRAFFMTEKTAAYTP